MGQLFLEASWFSLLARPGEHYFGRKEGRGVIVMADKDYSYCVIGAGPAGLAAAKNLKQWDIPVEVIEREDDIGGNWYFGKPYSSVCSSTHLITSKRFSEYTDFPMPERYPTYIHHSLVLEYLRSYARAFGLYDNIRFNQSVTRVEPAEGGKYWDVTLESGETRRYRGVLIANGHGWDPNLPSYPGYFNGLSMHSSRYKTPDVLKDKRVLVVGAGNSGCDVAVESSHHAALTFHSTRRGYYYWPKYLFGIPSDEWAEISLALHVPLWMRRFFGKLILPMFTAGRPERYGVPKPDHKLFETHYILNSTLLYHIDHGDVIPKPDVLQLLGDQVLFKDGTREQIDVIIHATGFNISFPFIDTRHLNWKQGRPDWYLNVFHPDYDNLFLIGLFQTSTGFFPLMDHQSQLVARFLYALEHDVRKADWLKSQKVRTQPNIRGGITYTGASRHRIECEHYSYRSQLKRHIAKIAMDRPRSVRLPLATPQPVSVEK